MLALADKEGRPVADAKVVLLDGTSPPLDVAGVTDESGAWRIRQLPPGEYLIGATPRGSIRQVHRKVSWTLEPEPVELVTPRE